MRISKITTKVGDKGMTHLGDGCVIPKDSLIIKTIGLIDDANAKVGHAIVVSPNKEKTRLLKSIQNDLFNIGGEIALGEKSESIFSHDRLSEIESNIQSINQELQPLEEFVYPGGTEFSARLHLTRTAIRQAEISLFSLNQDSEIRDSILQYMNRLSDFFFVLARQSMVENNQEEDKWDH